MTSGPISGIPLGQLFSRNSHPSTPALRDIQENNLGGVSSGHAIPQLHPENSHKSDCENRVVSSQTPNYLNAWILTCIMAHGHFVSLSPFALNPARQISAVTKWLLTQVTESHLGADDQSHMSGIDVIGRPGAWIWRKCLVAPRVRPCVPLFMLISVGLEAKWLWDF